MILLPAILLTAIVVGLVRGLRPDRKKLVRSAWVIGLVLLFCLVPRLLAAPDVRPYPTAGEVLARFLGVTLLGLGLAALAWGIGSLARPRR